MLLVPKHEGLTFLEQLTVFALEGRCSNPSVPYLYHVDNVGKITFARGACNMWSCPECAMKNAKRWIARIIDGINKLDSDAWYFATVTAHRWWRGDKSLINLRSNWHKLRKRMARMAKKMAIELYYTRVWEHHKDGSYHLHLITNVPLTQKWLKDNAAECGMGYQAHMDDLVNAGQAAGYVAKYMLKQSKDDTLHSFPKGARRIEVSGNWVSWHEKKSEGWHYSGNLEQSIGKARWMKYYGKTVHDLALRRDENERKKAYDKRTDSNGRATNGHASAGELVTGACGRKTRFEGQNQRLPNEALAQSSAKATHQDISKRAKQSTIKDERILSNGQAKDDKDFGASVSDKRSLETDTGT